MASLPGWEETDQSCQETWREKRRWRFQQMLGRPVPCPSRSDQTLHQHPLHRSGSLRNSLLRVWVELQRYWGPKVTASLALMGPGFRYDVDRQSQYRGLSSVRWQNYILEAGGLNETYLWSCLTGCRPRRAWSIGGWTSLHCPV